MNLALPLLLTLGAAHAAPTGTLAYLKDGAAWVTRLPANKPQMVPQSRGAALLAVSPATGSLAFLTGPAGTNVTGKVVPPLTPYLSKAPYTSSVRLSTLVPAPRLNTVKARWLTFEGDGRNLIAGTDEGTVGWNLVKRRSFIPNQTPLYQSTSADGDVTATLGSVQSPDEPGVLLYGPGARPGTEVFTRSLPGALMSALRAQANASVGRFTAQLDPQAQKDDANWVVTSPRVTRDGRAVFFATNAGWGVGSAGTTTYALFQVKVEDVALRALGWLGTLSGSALERLPAPDGKRLLILLTRHVSNVEKPVTATVADLSSKTARPLPQITAPAGRTAVLGGACWLADGRHVAISVAHPRPQELHSGNGFLPPAGAFTLLVLNAQTGQVTHRIPGGTQPACAST